MILWLRMLNKPKMYILFDEVNNKNKTKQKNNVLLINIDEF